MWAVYMRGVGLGLSLCVPLFANTFVMSLCAL